MLASAIGFRRRSGAGACRHSAGLRADPGRRRRLCGDARRDGGPRAVQFGGAGVSIDWASLSAGLTMAGQQMFDISTNHGLTVIPLFVLMGAFIHRADLSADLYDARQCLSRPSARRAGDEHDRCLRRFCRRLRLVDRHRRDHGARRHAVDAALPLCRQPFDRRRSPPAARLAF